MYQSATYRVCDSQVLMYAAKLMGQPLQEKISGSDLLPAFCEYYRNDPDITIFLLGGMEGVAAEAKERINQKVGRVLERKKLTVPIGTLLQEAGLITETQLSASLEEPTYQRHLLFGELLAKKGLIQLPTADFFVEEFPQLCENQKDYPLGEYFKAAGLLEQDQIRLILDKQRHTSLRFGEIAIQEGFLNPKTVEFFSETLKDHS